MVNEVKQQGKARVLPNGRTYCVELAKTEGTQDECALDLEDAFYLSERDKARMVDLVVKGVERHRRAIQPCGWWKRTFQRSKCDPGAALR